MAGALGGGGEAHRGQRREQRTDLKHLDSHHGGWGFSQCSGKLLEGFEQRSNRI